MAAHFVRLGAVVLSALCALAGCSRGEPDSSGASPMGRTFVSTAVEGAPIPGGGPLTLAFAEGRVTAEAGCNTYTGNVSLEGHKLRVSGLAGTLMACDGDREGADRWVTTLLDADPDWRLDDVRLVLRDGDRTVTLIDKKTVAPDKPLRGTPWLVTALITPEGRVRSRALDEAAPTLVVAEDGTVSGTTGCNPITGSAEITDSAIVFRVSATKKKCAAEVMEVERAVLTALDGETTARIDGNDLALRNENGSGLVLRAR